MARCKSGKHEWSNPADAAKCCNGWHRVLVLGDLRACATVGHDPLPGPTLYGFTWARDTGPGGQKGGEQ